MDERINLLLSYEENYYNEKEITPFSDRLDTELNQIKNHLDKIRFLKLLQLSIDRTYFEDWREACKCKPTW